MKAQKQKAGRTPAKPQSQHPKTAAANPGEIRMTFRGELADLLRPLPPEQQGELIGRGVRLMLLNRAENDEALRFKLRADQLERVFHHSLKPSLSIGRDQLTGRWLKLEPDGEQPERELTLPEALRELAECYVLMGRGFIAGHEWDDAGMVSLLRAAAEAIAPTRHQPSPARS